MPDSKSYSDKVEQRDKSIALAKLSRILRKADMGYLEHLIDVMKENHPEWADV